jgi:ribonuclease P protein component
VGGTSSDAACRRAGSASRSERDGNRLAPQASETKAVTPDVKVATLRHTPQIQALIRRGTRVQLDRYVVYFEALLAEEESAIAIQIPKKVGNAVRRNYLRRVIKETCRKNFPKFLRPGRFVFIVKIQGRSADFWSTKEEFERFFTRNGFLPVT